MNATALRNSTRAVTELLGYQFNPSLPILDDIRLQRDCDEVANRILTLYVSIACSYGFPKKDGIEWLKREGLWESATDNEREFLEGKADSIKSTIQWQVEALWSLTWAASYHDELDFAKPCSDSFIGMFPDLKKGESASRFKRKCQLRSIDQIGEKLDLSYCLHWAVRDSELSNSSRGNRVERQVIVERRRSLEWLVGTDDWDEVSLDT